MNLFTLALLLGSLFVLSSCAAYKVLRFVGLDERLANFLVAIQTIKGGETFIPARLSYKDVLFKTEENVFILGIQDEKKE
jgi:hypothetical protein